jgi:hypothetical protein
MEVQQIPAGVITVTKPNQMFRISMEASKIGRKAREEEQKNLPKPKRSK